MGYVKSVMQVCKKEGIMSVSCFACRRVGRARKGENEGIQNAVKVKTFKDHSALKRVVCFTKWECATSGCYMNGQWIGDKIVGSYSRK